MPLTATEKDRLTELRNKYPEQKQPEAPQPKPPSPLLSDPAGKRALASGISPVDVEAGVTTEGIRSVPVPEDDIFTPSPNLDDSENNRLEILTRKFRQQELPTIPPRAFKNTADEFVRAVARGTLNVGSGLLAQFADVGRASIFDVDKINELAEKAREISRKPKFQPGTDGGVRGFIVNAVGDALPFMAGTIAATLIGGPVAGFSVAYAVEGKNAYFDALDAGASQEEAELEGFVVGSINAALELLQVERVIRFAKSGKGTIGNIIQLAKAKSFANLKRTGKALGKEALKLSITEGVQEALQETTSTLAPALTGRPLPTFNEAIKRIGTAFLGGAVAGPILGGAGAVVQTMVASKGFEKKTTFSRKDVKEIFGVDRSTAEERQKLFNKVKAEIEAAGLEKGVEDARRIREEAEEAGEEARIEARQQEVQRLRVRESEKDRLEAQEREKVAPAEAEEVVAPPEEVAQPPKKKKGKKLVSEAEFQKLQAEEAEAQKVAEKPKKKGKKAEIAEVTPQAEIIIKSPLTPKGDFRKNVEDIHQKKNVLLPKKDQAAAKLKKFVSTVPEFAEKAEFTVQNGMLIFQDGGRFRFEPGTLGLKADQLKEGQVVKFDLESYGIKPPSAKKVEKAKALGLKAPAEAFGAKNKIVDKAEFEKLKAEETEAKPARGKRAKGFRKGSARIFTAKDITRAGKFGVYYFEGGLRKFADWSAQMVKTMGEAVRPHLEKIWAESKRDVEAFEAEPKKAEKETPSPAEAPKKAVRQKKGKKVEVAKPENLSTANTAKELNDELGKALSVKNLTMGEMREDLGLGNVPSAQRKKQQTSIDNAIKDKVPEKALRIATEVQESPRQMTDEEEAGLLVRSVQLRDEYEGAKKQITTTVSEAEKDMLNAEMNRVEAEFDIISRATKTAGTEIARALAFRRNFIDESYDILSVKTRARAAKGKELTETEVAKFEELVANLDIANEKIVELQAKMDEVTANNFVKVSKRSKRTVSQRNTDIENLGTKINQLLEQGCI